MSSVVTLGTPHNGDFTVEYIMSLILLQNRMIQEGKHSLRINLFETCLVHQGRNHIFRDCKDDWLLFVDSDVAFPADGLETLISRKKDIIGGIYHSRKAPHLPLAFTRNPDGKFSNITEFPDEPFQVDSIATGFLLISRKVIEAMKDDYPFDFIRREDGFELGEDMAFCVRAKEKGFEVWCDPSVKLVHVGKSLITRNDFLAYQEYEKSNQ